MRAANRRLRSLALIPVLALASAACASTGGTPRPFPGARVTVAPPARPPAGVAPTPTPSDPIAALTHLRFDGRAVAQFALGFRGVPYRPGGSTPSGFDCSGLVQYVFAQYGIAVPRLAEDQFDVGQNVRASDIRPGDLMFFNTKSRGSGASHVAIAIARDRFVHAPNSTGVVRVETLASSYWGARYIGARRLTPSGASN